MSGSRYANIPKLSKGLLKRADFLYMCLAIASPLASQKGVNIIFLISNFHHSSLRHSTSYSRGPACTASAMLCARLHHAVDLTEWSAGNNFKDPSCLHIWCPLTPESLRDDVHAINHNQLNPL